VQFHERTKRGRTREQEVHKTRGCIIGGVIKQGIWWGGPTGRQSTGGEFVKDQSPNVEDAVSSEYLMRDNKGLTERVQSRRGNGICRGRHTQLGKRDVLSRQLKEKPRSSVDPKGGIKSRELGEIVITGHQKNG